MVRWSLALASLVAATVLLGTAAAAGGGCHPDSTTTSDARGAFVDIKGCKFAPTVLFAPVGATVRWTFGDNVPHNVVGLGWGDTAFLTGGATREYTFATAGIYPYHCSLHPGMAGVVIVGDADLTGASAPVAVAPSPTPAPTPVPTFAPTAQPTTLVASASAPARPAADTTLLAAGLGALVIAGAAGFAFGRRKSTAA